MEAHPGQKYSEVLALRGMQEVRKAHAGRSEEVHYIIPLSQGGTNEDGDLMSLCARCHPAITAKKGGRWG